MKEMHDQKELLEFVQVAIEVDAKQNASELAQYIAFVFCSPMELFRLWLKSFIYYITTYRL